MEEIKIRIGKDGKLALSVNGMKGDACKSVTKTLERALGMVVETKNTGEYYEQQQAVSGEQTVGGGDGS